MKCAKAKKLVWLYRELEGSEQQRLNEHLQGCASCRTLLEGLEQNRLLFKEATDLAAEDDHRLKDAILHEVQNLKREKEELFPIRFRLAGYPSLRLGFSLISLVLVVVFLVEFQGPQKPATGTRVVQHSNDGATVLLKSSRFHQLSLPDPGERSLSHFSLSACIRACKGQEQLVCAECKTKAFND